MMKSNSSREELERTKVGNMCRFMRTYGIGILKSPYVGYESVNESRPDNAGKIRHPEAYDKSALPSGATASENDQD